MRTSESLWLQRIVVAPGAALLLASACEQAPPPLDDGPVAIASASDGELDAELLVLGGRGLAVGRNSIGLRLSEQESGAVIDAASITQAWLMTMDSESHGCPDQDPGGAADDEGLFPAAVVLPMATSAGGSWSSTVTVQVDGGAAHELAFSDLTVANSDRAQMLTGSDGGTYLVSLSFTDGVAPAVDPVAGDNPILVTAHSQAGPTEFDAADDLVVGIAADMPSMGHGSSTPSSASLRGDGEYQGSVDLSMPGAWVVTVTLQRAGEALGVAEFDVTL